MPNKKKGQIGLIIVIFLFLIILVIVIVHLQLKRRRLQLGANTITFLEQMKYNKPPLDLSGEGSKTICGMKGSSQQKKIPANWNTLMFWVKTLRGTNLSTKPLPLFKNSNKTSIFSITPNVNTLNITDTNSKTIVTIDNLPFDEWVCVQVTLKDNVLDVYINGKLMKTKKGTIEKNLALTTLPFPGKLAFLQTSDDYMDPHQIFLNYQIYKEIIDKYEMNKFNKNLNSFPKIKLKRELKGILKDLSGPRNKCSY